MRSRVISIQNAGPLISDKKCKGAVAQGPAKEVQMRVDTESRWDSMRAVVDDGAQLEINESGELVIAAIHECETLICVFSTEEVTFDETKDHLGELNGTEYNVW